MAARTSERTHPCPRCGGRLGTAFAGNRSCRNCGLYLPPPLEFQREPGTARPSLISPTQLRELRGQVLGETSKAISAAGFTPATAARRARFPQQVIEDFTARRKLLSSFTLGRLLRVCKAPETTVTRLVTAMAVIETSAIVVGMPIWEPPALDVTDADLQITNRVELATVLLKLQEMSGLPKLQLAIQAGIPRSQLYNLIDPDRHARPRNRDQLYAFLRTCSLSERQTEHVLRQWEQLDRQQATTTTISVDNSPNAEVAVEPEDEHLPDQPALWGPISFVVFVMIGLAVALYLNLPANGILSILQALAMMSAATAVLSIRRDFHRWRGYRRMRRAQQRSVQRRQPSRQLTAAAAPHQG
jgi:hypothetical protein